MAAVVLCVPLRAAAERADVERAYAAYEAGEFDEAAAALVRARGGQGLSRDDVIRVLSLEALLAHAASDAERLEAVSLALASLTTDDPLGPSAPPSVHEAYAAARARVTVPLAVRWVPSGEDAVRAEVVGDRGALVTSIRVQTRAPGGAWQRAEGAVAPLVDDLEIQADAIGIGGAVLATATRDDLREDPLPPVTAEPAEPIAAAAGSDDGLIIGLTVGGIAAVLIAVGVVLGVVLSAQPSGNNVVAAPTVTFP